MGGFTLVEGDYLSVLRGHDGEFDCLVSDAPYRWNKTSGGRAQNDEYKNKWQGQLHHDTKVSASLRHNNVRWEEWLPVAYRALRANAHAYVFTNDKNMQSALNAATAAGFRLHNILCWRKNNATPNKWYMKRFEFILFLFKGRAFHIAKRGTSQDLHFDSVPGLKKLHPTEKPVDLLRVLIENSTQPGEVVLDPFAGSGSTGEAALRLGRRFFGVELDHDYVEIAKDRLTGLKPDWLF